ncbi:hypothetical protein [Cellulomonas sp. P5_C6]
MPTATARRRAHLETVIEFEMEPHPVDPPSHDLGTRALRVRRLLGISGAVIGVLVAGVMAAGIASSPATTTPPATAHTLEASRTPGGTSCVLTAATPTRPGEPHLRCAVPTPGSPSAKVAMRAADDAAAARAWAWAQTHGPGTGTSRRGNDLSWPASSQRLWVP